VNSWINLHALWQIVVVGLIAGAGLPALFAVGLVALNQPGSGSRKGSHSAPAGATAGSAAGSPAASGSAAAAGQVAGGSVIGLIAAVLCFAVVLAGVGWGIYFIVAGS
jgi:hypothetical protein